MLFRSGGRASPPPLKLELRDLLPRITLSSLYEAAHIAPLHSSTDLPLIAGISPAMLWRAAERAFALGPEHLSPTTRNNHGWRWVTARAAAVQLAVGAGIPRAEMLQVQPFAARTWSRMVQRPLPVEALDAVRLQLALQEGT
ncbi:MAG: hypothetical protein JRH20_25635 [Deltaproteobacteria bacterium]|nr:hypothetical protein [Deltaproteobacteria bacterium]